MSSLSPPLHRRLRLTSMDAEGFRAHDPEGIVEGHHLAATHAPGGMHVTVAVRTLTFDEAVFPQLK